MKGRAGTTLVVTPALMLEVLPWEGKKTAAAAPTSMGSPSGVPGGRRGNNEGVSVRRITLAKTRLAIHHHSEVSGIIAGRSHKPDAFKLSHHLLHDHPIHLHMLNPPLECIIAPIPTQGWRALPHLFHSWLECDITLICTHRWSASAVR